MIDRAATERTATNRLEKAGLQAEHQMSFYLKRAFESDKRFRVINDIRLEINGDAAQVDHLVISDFGFFFIESKSVSSEVHINNHLEWSRVYQGKHTGMPSPILQAKRQINFVQDLLQAEADRFFKKRKVMNPHFGRFLWQPIVAISDSGIISGEAHPSEVMKADQVTEYLIQTHEELQKRQDSLFSSSLVWSMSSNTIQEVVSFLISHHTPLKSQSKVASKMSHTTPIEEVIHKSSEEKTTTPEVSVSDYQCKKCHQSNLNVLYSKFGYYFKCLDCDTNTSIPKTVCHCGTQLKVSKRKETFSMVCKECESSELFWTNHQG